MDAEGILMHIDRADEIAMTAKPAAAADPVSAPGLVCVLAPRTPATGASFGAGEARDGGLFAFVGQIVNILAILPLRYAAIVVMATVAGTDPTRVADEERADLVLDTEVDHSPAGFVPQIADAPLGSAADLVLRALQLLPAARVLLAPALLFGELPELSASLPLERADAAPGDDRRRAFVRGHGGQVVE